MQYTNLLSPIQIGNHIIKNRLVYPNASPHFLQGPETFPAEGYRAFNANLAKNGAGIVTVAEWNDEEQHIGPADFDFTHMQSIHLSDPSVHNYISQMADEVHFFQSKIIVAISLQFPEGYSHNGGRSWGRETKPFTIDMIEEIIHLNVEKARFYKLQGFDGMTIRCDGHMQPKANERKDDYGGSLYNRTKLLRACLKAIRDEFGADFIIEGEVAWEQVDGYDGRIRKGSGYTEADCLELMHLCEGIVDIFQIREHNICDAHPTGYSFPEGVHPNLDFCKRAKRAGIKQLLEPIGGYQDPELMEKAIREGICDLFGAARAFMADYEYGKKLAEGRGEDITPCLLCNKCHGTIYQEHDPWVCKCSVNPILDKTNRLYRLVEQDYKPAKVAVIGGGPAGMRAALYASERGHTVTLYEKSSYLGGQLFHADYFSFKWPLKKYRLWLIDQLHKRNVEVIMNHEPTREELEAKKFDALIVATGAVAKKPNIDGIDQEGIYTCLEGITRESGQKVVIVGGSEAAIETAMHLCESGKEVTILTRQKEIGHNCSKLHYITMNFLKEGKDGIMIMAPAWEKYHDLKGITEVTTLHVEPKSVTYQDKEGRVNKLACDTVLISGGMHNLTGEAMNYAGITPKFFVIGDCGNQAGNLAACNYQAYSAAMNI